MRENETERSMKKGHEIRRGGMCLTGGGRENKLKKEKKNLSG